MQVETEQATANFVAQLNGRFQDFISDKALITLLNLQINWNNNTMMQTTNKMVNSAYLSGVFVFEILLENGCGANLNGHHVAQDYATYLKNSI